MMKTCVVALTVAAWSVAGAAFARPVIQDKATETTAVAKDAAAGKSKAAADTTAPPAKKSGKVVSDETITTEVKTRLTKDKVARATSIDVVTKDGVVKITGSVPASNDVIRIGNIVDTTKGVKSVVNDLIVVKPAK